VRAGRPQIPGVLSVTREQEESRTADKMTKERRSREHDGKGGPSKKGKKKRGREPRELSSVDTDFLTFRPLNCCSLAIRPVSDTAPLRLHEKKAPKKL